MSFEVSVPAPTIRLLPTASGHEGADARHRLPYQSCGYVPPLVEPALRPTSRTRRLEARGASAGRCGFGRRRRLRDRFGRVFRHVFGVCFNVSAAALDIGAVSEPSAEAAAAGYVEDIFRRGQVAIPEELRAGGAVPARSSHASHEVRREDDNLVLVRLHFKC